MLNIAKNLASTATRTVSGVARTLTGGATDTRTKAARKAAATRREDAAKRSEAAEKAAQTRKAKAAKRSAAAKKAAGTRRRRDERVEAMVDATRRD